MKIVSKEALKTKVNETVTKLPEDVVFIAGIRKITNGQVQAEFVQHRSLSGRKTSMLALLNAGDARFNSGRTTMRTWLMVNHEGFKATFGIDLKEAIEMAQTTKEDEVVGLFTAAKTVNVNGIVHPIKIVCKETINVEDLPKSIREQIQDENVSDEIKNRYILQTAEGDRIVDALGNNVYRRYELSYGEDDDVLVANKVLLSELSKKAAGVNTTVNTDELLKGVLAE